MNYSQNDEQAAIERFFMGQYGTFLDIGAYDGKTISNTYHLLEVGWLGTLVEPSPHNFVELMKNTEQFIPRVELILAAVSERKAGSGLSKLFIDKYPDRKWSVTVSPELVASGSVMIPSPANVLIPLLSITHPVFSASYDFISIDAEWEDGAILLAMPNAMLSACKLLCIEPMNMDERKWMKDFLSGKGFKTYHETPENLLVCHA